MDEHGPYMDGLNPDAEWAEGGGTIRFYPGTVNQTTGNFSGGEPGYPPGPTIHANSTHTASGLRSLDVKGSGAGGGDLVISHDTPGRITSINCDPDETMAPIALSGISGGVGTMIVRLYRRSTGARLYLHHQDDYDYLSGLNINLWVGFKGLRFRGSADGKSPRTRLDELEPQFAQLQADYAVLLARVDAAGIP